MEQSKGKPKENKTPQQQQLLQLQQQQLLQLQQQLLLLWLSNSNRVVLRLLHDLLTLPVEAAARSAAAAAAVSTAAAATLVLLQS